MATIRLTERDLPKLNRILTEYSNDATKFRSVQAQIGALVTMNNFDDINHARVLEDNMVFMWNGGSLTITWAQGYIKLKDGSIISIPAGTSQALVADTYYWVCWNQYHQVMSFVTSLDTIFSVTSAAMNTFVLCQLKTGSNIQTGTAGGGGTNSGAGGAGLTGGRFSLF